MAVTQLRPSGQPRWWSALKAELARRKVATSAELAKALDLDPDRVEGVLLDSPEIDEVEGGWTLLETLCDGAVFTHSITEDELAAGILHTGDDLGLWARLAHDGFPLSTGGRLKTEPREGESTLSGPDDWLAGFGPGDLVAVRLREGAFEVSRADGTASKDAAKATLELTAAFHREAMEYARIFADRVANGHGAQQGAPIEDVLILTFETRPELFATPILPISAILGAAGVEVREGRVAVPGAPWDAREIPGMSPSDIMALTLVRGGLRTFDADSDLGNLIELLGGAPAIHRMIADEAEASPRDLLDGLRTAATTPREEAVVNMLAARAAEAGGDPDAASALAEKAAAYDIVPALLDAAEHAAARGDHQRTDDLLKRAGVASDDMFRRHVRPLVAAPDTDIPRNRPCPCGSGRKFKQCCQRTLTHPLRTRAALLYAMLIKHAERPKYRPRVDEIAAAGPRQAVSTWLDLALFERGIAAEFARERGGRLRDDERKLLNSWLATPLRLHEVTATRPGHELTVRPLPADGDPVTLRDRTLSSGVRHLDLLLLRPLDDGAGQPTVFTEPLQINRHRRPQLLELVTADPIDPVAIASFFAPQRPQLANRDGHELVQCSARYEVEAPDDEDAWQRLAESIETDGPDLLVSQRDDGIIRGFVRRSATRWTIETNSLERLRTLQELLLAAAPDARQIDESSVPMEQLLDGEPPEPPEPPTLPQVPSKEELETFMLDFMIKQEERWIDESIPALAGLTPRQAVRQGGAALVELHALLDDIDWAHRQPADMSGERIRRLLGL